MFPCQPCSNCGTKTVRGGSRLLSTIELTLYLSRAALETLWLTSVRAQLTSSMQAGPIRGPAASAPLACFAHEDFKDHPRPSDDPHLKPGSLRVDKLGAVQCSSAVEVLAVSIHPRLHSLACGRNVRPAFQTW